MRKIKKLKRTERIWKIATRFMRGNIPAVRSQTVI